MENMKAAVLYGKDDLRFSEVEKPTPKDREVLIKVMVSGICGSDVPRVLGEEAHFYPLVLGHEFSGRVVGVGTEVTKVKIGEKVAGAPLIPCHVCRSCKQGDHALCKEYSFIGSRQQGSFAEYVCIPEENAVVLGENVTYEEGAFFEPSTVALHALKRFKYVPGKKVAILGGGTIGIFTMQWAKIFGAKEVYVFDIDDARLSLAKDLGAEKTLNVSNEHAREELDEIIAAGGFDYVYEAAGYTETMKLAFELAGNKSKVCLIGTPKKNLEFTPKEFEQINRKEFFLTGSWMSYSAPFPGDEWSLTAHYFSTGQLKILDKMVLKRFPLSKAKQAFDLFKNPKGVGGKIFLLSSEDENNSFSEDKHHLLQIVDDQKKGKARGIFSVCSTNPFVLESSLRLAKEKESHLLIEPTPNQVNQYRGYSGMNPFEFRYKIEQLAKKYEFPFENIILGGDHLGPLVWRDESEESAMEKAEELVRQFVLAGFTKIHLDTTMKLASDDPNVPLDTRIISKRGVRLMKKAEKTYKELLESNPDASHLVYVIGSEVPAPGGKQDSSESLKITSPEDFRETVKVFRDLLTEEGVEDLRSKIFAIVVQPGAEFGDREIHEYNRGDAQQLSQSLKEFGTLVFEGHSTDYQKPSKLKEMIQDGIAILKVGPALTFALRKTLYVLEEIEKGFLKNRGITLSNFGEILEEVMFFNHEHWKHHHIGSEGEIRSLIRTGFSDRGRYYLEIPRVKESIEILLLNVEGLSLSDSILQKFFPEEEFKESTGPREIIYQNIKKVLEGYFEATGQKNSVGC